MADMGLQERYEDIARLSGLSEEHVRRVLRASKQSIAISLKKGKRATLPGLCTFVPEIRNRIAVGGTELRSYIKVKASASNALTSELERCDTFEDVKTKEKTEEQIELNRTANDIGLKTSSGIRTNQISALM